MSVEEPLPDDVAESIERCAAVVADLPRLTDELHVLRLSSDPRAQLATSLFDLERARRGDADARANLLEVADSLLVFWRQGNGHELAGANPVLESLWARATALLLAFEARRFTLALEACWEARADAARLTEAIEDLQPEGNRRVEFARCLYHLELARLSVEGSRAEFARRAGLLAEAYQDPEVARELVGDDAGLDHLWTELVPYLDEFFEHLEEQAERAARASAPSTPASEGTTDMVAAYQPPPPPRSPPPPPPRQMPLATDRHIPSFRTLIGDRPGTPPAPDVESPPDPVGMAADTLDEELEEVEGTAAEVELDAADLVEVSGPLPPPLPRRSSVRTEEVLASADDEDDDGAGPDPATREFWRHTFDRLGLDPGEDGRSPRLLACESRAERRRLAAFVESLEPFSAVPEARAFACLVGLMLAGQTREKNLFGQPNLRRGEAMAAALPWLWTTPRAVGHVAVWFELDGPQTQAALQSGLELLGDYLAHCARTRMDPLAPASIEAYTGVGR